MQNNILKYDHKLTDLITWKIACFTNKKYLEKQADQITFNFNQISFLN